MQLRGLIRVLPLIVQNLGGNDADAVDLLAEPGVVNGVIDGTDLLQHRVLRSLLLGLLRLLGLLLGGVIQALAGDHQHSAAQIQITVGEQVLIQHILQIVPDLGGGGPGGRGQGGQRDTGAPTDHGQVLPEAAYLLLPAQAHQQAPRAAAQKAEDGQQVHHVLQEPDHISVEQPIKGVAGTGDRGKQKYCGKYSAYNGQRAAFALQRSQLGVAGLGGELRGGLWGGGPGAHRSGIGAAGVGGAAASRAFFPAQ